MTVRICLISLYLIYFPLYADTPTDLPADSPTAASQGHQFLSKFVGHWEGVSTDGHFKEVTEYRWGPGKTHLLLDMSFYMDGAQTGSASGFFAWDESASGLVFHMVSSQGVVITQQQYRIVGDRIEMNAQAINGAAVGFPPEFRTAFIIGSDGTYDSEVMIPAENGSWQTVMSNHFEKID